LTAELARAGVQATQSSVSRDINDLNLTKINGYYSLPEINPAAAGPVIDIDTAGDHLVIVKTQVGLAQPTALTIDRAKLDEIVGTVAGDDTIMIAVKNAPAQRMAIKKINGLFAPAPVRTAVRTRRRPAAHTLER
jgi:transcriptional regulator of arginine metabolism